jgi:hypothetical protein
MKKLKSALMYATIAVALSSCAYTRIGDLTMISSRNIDSNTDYKLIQKYVVGKAKSNKGDALQTAIDNAVKSVPDGEFLKNVRVYVKNNGTKVKIEGDVWGIPTVEKNVTKTVNEKIEFKTGDRVTFRNAVGNITEGTILGLNQNTAIIEYKNSFGKDAKTEMKYEKLTKIEK